MEVRTYLARARQKIPMPSFAAVLADVSPLEQFNSLRAGLGNPDLPTTTVLRLLNKVLCGKALESVRHGTAAAPRSGFLQPTDKHLRGTDKRRLVLSDVSNIVFNHSGSSLQCVLPKSGGKFAAIWIARYDTVKEWIFQSWTQGRDDLFKLGVIRLVSSVSTCGRRLSVEPRIEQLPSSSGISLRCSSEVSLPVLALLLQDLHKCVFAYMANSRALKARISSPGGLEDENAMRQFLGLQPELNSPIVSPWITVIFGAPCSPERDEFVTWTGNVLEKIWTPKQREVLRKWGSHVLVPTVRLAQARPQS